jgi:hypothetical protein
MILEEIHATHVQIFHQEKNLQDLLRTAGTSGNSSHDSVGDEPPQSVGSGNPEPLGRIILIGLSNLLSAARMRVRR